MPKAEKPNDYAGNINRINAIIEQLKGKDCEIDEMIGLVEEAARLIKSCQQILGSTDMKIRDALDDLTPDNAETPFD